MRQRGLNTAWIPNDIKELLLIFHWNNDIVHLFFKMIFYLLEIHAKNVYG